MGYLASTPVDKMYQEAQLLAAPSLKDFIDRVSKLPLLYQPGEGWVYSVRWTSKATWSRNFQVSRFRNFVRERIFEPLGMKDTGFYVPARKARPRCDDLSRRPRRALAPCRAIRSISKPPGLPSGGGGLYSTARDYLRFAQMVLNGGELNGVRLVAPSSIELMRTQSRTGRR